MESPGTPDFVDPFASNVVPLHAAQQQLHRYPWPTYAPAELENLPQAEVNWIVRGIVARGCVTELTADIRAGKTTFSAEMVAAMREGRPFLGQPTSWARVMWLSEEGGVTFRQAMHRARLHTADPHEIRCTFRQDVTKVAWPMLIDNCRKDLAPDGGLLIVDTLSRFVGVGPDQENDPAIAARAMEPLLQAARSGMAVLVHRHARKGGGDVATAGRGSSAWSADCDIMLLLRRPPRQEGSDEELSTRTRSRILEAASRFLETPGQEEPCTIALTADGYGIVAGDTARQQRYEDMDEQILLYVASHAGCTKTDVKTSPSIRGKDNVKVGRVAELIRGGKLIERPSARPTAAGRERTVAGLFIGPLA